eukprot:403332066
MSVPVSAEQSISRSASVTEMDCIKQIQCSSYNSADTLQFQSDIVSLNGEILNCNTNKYKVQNEGNFKIEKIAQDSQTDDTTCPNIPPEQIERNLIEIDHFEGIDEHETSDPSLVSLASPQNERFNLDPFIMNDSKLQIYNTYDGNQCGRNAKGHHQHSKSLAFQSYSPVKNQQDNGGKFKDSVMDKQQQLSGVPTKSLQSIAVFPVSRNQRRSNLQSYQDAFISQNNTKIKVYQKSQRNVNIISHTQGDDSFEKECELIDLQQQQQQQFETIDKFSNTERKSNASQLLIEDIFKSTNSDMSNMNLMGLYKQYTQNYGNMPASEVSQQKFKNQNTQQTSGRQSTQMTQKLGGINIKRVVKYQKRMLQGSQTSRLTMHTNYSNASNIQKQKNSTVGGSNIGNSLNCLSFNQSQTFKATKKQKRDTYSCDLDSFFDLQLTEIAKGKEKKQDLKIKQSLLIDQKQKIATQMKKLKLQTTLLQQQIYDQEQNNLKMSIDNHTLRLQLDEFRALIDDRQNENFSDQQSLLIQKREQVQIISKLQSLIKQEKQQYEQNIGEQKELISIKQQQIGLQQYDKVQLEGEIQVYKKQEKLRMKLIRQKEILLESVIKEEDSEEENKSARKSRRVQNRRLTDKNLLQQNESLINKTNIPATQRQNESQNTTVKEPLALTSRNLQSNIKTPQNKENSENFNPFKSFNSINFKKKASQNYKSPSLNSSSSLNYSKTFVSREEFKKLNINNL